MKQQIINAAFEAAKESQEKLTAYIADTLSGDKNLALRQEIYSQLTGKEQPKKACGIGAITKEVWAQVQSQMSSEVAEPAVAMQETQAIELPAELEVKNSKCGKQYIRRTDLETLYRSAKVATYLQLKAAFEKLGIEKGGKFALLHRQKEVLSNEFSTNLVFEFKGSKYTPTVEKFAANYRVFSEGVEISELTNRLRAVRNTEQLIEFWNALPKDAILENAAGVQVSEVLIFGFNTVHSEAEGKTFELGCRTYNLLSHYRIVEIV